MSPGDLWGRTASRGLHSRKEFSEPERAALGRLRMHPAIQLGTEASLERWPGHLRERARVLSKRDRFICAPSLLEMARDRPQEHWAEGRDGGAGQDDPAQSGHGQLALAARASGNCAETPRPDVWADFVGCCIFILQVISPAHFLSRSS